MPRSRTSRSASPLTQRPLETSISSEQEQIFQNVKEIFQSTLDDDIVRLVLMECNWRDEVAIDKLLAIAEDAEAQNHYKQKKSQLRKIAEDDKCNLVDSNIGIWVNQAPGVLGPISFEDYKRHGSVRAPIIPDSKLSATERIIGRPVKNEERTTQSNSNLHGNPNFLVPRGSAASSKTRLSPNSEDIDIDFPKLPSRPSASSSALSSEGSQPQQTGKYAGSLLRDSSFISQAQSAYNQQYDDAASAQRWEDVKEKLSEHYVGNIDHIEHETTALFPERHDLQRELNITGTTNRNNANLGTQGEVTQDTARPKSVRSFPVRLLNKDNEEDGRQERARKLTRLDSADLDDNIFKCIYEVPREPIDEEPVKDKKSGSGAGTPRSVTPGHGTPPPNNGPMTLPVIGLSVEAVEFVPRPKSSKVDSDGPLKTESSPSSPENVASKTSRSNPIEIKTGARNVKNSHSPGIPFGSPVHASPTVSPGLGQHLHGRSPPISSVTANQLAGSPVFLTYKWPQGLQCVSAAPAHQTPIFSGPRYIAGRPPQPHLTHATTFRLQGRPSPISFPGRMMYPMPHQPPFFRMAGVAPPRMAPLRPSHIHVPRHPTTDLEERAAIATGSPIMATAESHRTVPLTTVQGVKLTNPGWIAQWSQKIKDKQKAGIKVLLIVRGLPGSGKSTFARSIQMDGVVLSTDDFFIKGGYYTYNPDKLAESHQWNRERAKEAMKMGTTPIIIDNTNTQKWEFTSYVNMAIGNNYHVEIVEPDTPWKFKPKELAKKTAHGVPKDQIQRMMSRYEHNITVDAIIGKNKLNHANDKKGQVKKPVQDALDSESKAVKEAEVGSVKHPDNRSWDLNEEKAAHLSRHLHDGSEASTADRLSDHILPRGSPVPDIQITSENPSPTAETRSPDIKSVDSVEDDNPNEIYPDHHHHQHHRKDIRDQIGAIIPSMSSHIESLVKNEPPPFRKFKNSSLVERMTIGNSDNTEVCESDTGQHKRKLKQSNDHADRISSISSKLSADTLREVDEMLDVYMKDTNLSKDVLEKREEELGALLQLLPIDDKEEMNAAELLIHLRLHNSYNEEGDDGDDSSVGSVEIESEGRVQENEDSVDELSEDDNDDVHSVISDSIKPDYELIIESKEANKGQLGAEIEERPNDLGVETHAVTKDCETELKAESEHERHCQTLTEQSSSSNPDTNSELYCVNIPSVLTNTSDIELQYWNKVKKEDAKHAETVDTKWNDSADFADDWIEVVEEIECLEESMKPQREKKQRHVNNNMSPIDKTQSGEHEEDNRIKSKIDDIVTDQNGNNQNVNINENNESNTGPNSGNHKHVYDETCNELQHETTHSETILTMGNKSESIAVETSELMHDVKTIDEEAIIMLVDDVREKDTLEVLNCDIVDQEDIDMCTQTNATVNSTNETSCANTISAFTDNTIVPSLHNSSLDLLKEGYADMDVVEEDPVSAQDDINQSVISSQLDPATTSTSPISHESFKVNGNSLNSLNDTETETSKCPEILDRQTKQDGNLKESLGQISQSPKPKKKTHRKIAAVFPEPLLTNEEKQKLLSTNWTSLAVSHKSTTDVTNMQPESVNAPRHVDDRATMTSDDDFREVDNLARGGFVNSSLKYLIGTLNKVINSNHPSSTESPVITKVYLIDKSTSTDDLKDMSYSESVKFLKTCFPNVREDELECVLVNCHDNVEWAINLLLDWKYSMHLSEEEKQVFVDEMEKVKLANEPVKQPSSLTDLCFTMIELQNIATRDELEEQLIETSKERLERIEDENITKIRLRRSSSLNETLDDSRDSSYTAKMSPTALVRSASAPGEYDKQLEVLTERLDEQEKTDEVKVAADETEQSGVESKVDGNNVNNESVIQVVHDSDESVFVENSLDTHAVAEKVESRFVVKDKKMEKIRNKVAMKETRRVRANVPEDEYVADEQEESRQDVDGLDGEGKMGTPALTINLPRDTVVQLETLFGPLGSGSDFGDTPVLVDHKTALRLYQCIKHGANYRKQLQLEKDEEMARRLQEQEDSFANNQKGDNSRLRTNGKQRKYVPLDDRLTKIQTQGPASPGPVPLQVKSFESIMQEEEAEQKKKQEFQKLLELEGGPSTLSTRVKRLQLYEKFPTVDRSAIDRCFEANCFNMTETEEAIRWSLGPTEEKSGNGDSGHHDTPLIESTKRQSIQEMLDSYLYMPHASKDYQDGADPDYEDYRGEANLHHRMRHECFQKAQAAFRQGLKQVASFYSQQGHLHTQKIKEANMRASEQILADRNADLKNGTLDLHGLHIDEAIAALNRTLPDLERDRNKKHIFIITGRGSHSRGGIARLRPSVIAYLKRFHYTFVEEQTGVMKVTLKYRRSDK